MGGGISAIAAAVVAGATAAPDRSACRRCGGARGFPGARGSPGAGRRPGHGRVAGPQLE